MKHSLLILLYICFTVSSSAQFRNVLVDGANNPNEPAIAIDPKNPARLVAGSNNDNYYLSSDGGSTWSKGKITSVYGVWGDPIFICDTLGSFYFFHLSNPTNGPFGNPKWIDRMVCQRMDNFSGVWSPGTYPIADTFKKQDKPGLAYDAKRDRIYMAWTQFDEYGTTDPQDSSLILFSSSSDRGNTWTPAVRISAKGGDCVDGDQTVEGATPAVGPNGEVYVSWAGPNGLVFNRSFDGGLTWLPNETLVATIPGGWDYDIPGINRCNGLPFTACDVSNGPHKGNVYINWSDQRNGTNNTDIWFARSGDSGRSWTAPFKVNNDTGAHHQFMSSMTIDQATGYIYILFYDRRNDFLIATETEVYLAVSKDGGNTFSNIKISQTPFYPFNNLFFGDYTYIAAHNGVVRPIWGRVDGFQTTIWTAIIDFPLGTGEHPTNGTRFESIYPNPFISEASIPFTLQSSAPVSLTVTDMLGRTVATIYDRKELSPGYHVAHFNLRSYSLTPGVYTFQLIVGGERLVKQAVFSGQ